MADVFRGLTYSGRAIGMHMVSEAEQEMRHIAVGRIKIALLKFLDYDTFLCVDATLRECEVSHAVGLEPEGSFGIMGR